jgi:hypothetical protein
MAMQTLRVRDVELVVRCDDRLAVQARSVLELLAGLHGRGKGLADGVTVQVGWSVLTLRRRKEGLQVCEPDFDGDPFRNLRDDMTCTLAVLSGMTAVLHRVGVEGVPARFDEKVVLAKGCLGGRRVHLQRSEPEPGDSGWYVGPADGPASEQGADSYEAMYLFQLLRTRPALLQLLALPPGYLAVLDGNDIEAVVDPDNNDVWGDEP